ncbi:nuclease-like protein [Cytobacillus oceanisediminis]|uniref:Nuclease-like protein n=1 Tax=Cytobacillus oceanisediminis TaxID=665099 RepID=A0A2V2ZX48_9BACI|nr:nuclease-related domain-containing protein [Cytobacillus oceanisediminis]PWW27956.1 nuclease-like protein [Cytobacillus oceanisediminis]
MKHDSKTSLRDRRIETAPIFKYSDEAYFKELHTLSLLRKGFTGEKQFDMLLQSMPDESIILNDLLLEYSNTIFQIDSLLITGDCIYVFEIKNYEGDFYINHDKWCTTSKSEIKNPLLQLQRSESLLRRLLLDLGFNAPIKSYLIFINPEF